MEHFVHLHVHSEYSLLDGAARISALVRRAKELGMPALAITDHGVMYGVIDFYKEAQKHGVKPIIGCEVYVAPKSRFDKTQGEENYYHLVLLAADNEGYRNLIRLVSLSFLEGFYYKPRVDKELLRRHSGGLIALSACLGGEVPALLLKGDRAGALGAACEYREIFGAGNFYLELQDNGLPEQRPVNAALKELARETGIPLVATNDVHYLDRRDAAAHDVLLCIQTGKILHDADRLKFATDEFYFKTGTEMAALFPHCPEALANTAQIAARCNVTLDFTTLHLPEYPLPPGVTADAYLESICREGLKERYGRETPEIVARLDYELEVIRKMGYSGYFLVVWDFIRYAREKGILVGPGRGSAAGSLVAYCLGITNIDPLKYGLLFERFLNPERVSMPDIDVDFCFERRQEVIDYVISLYGAERVAQIITFGTMAAKAAIRDVGRVLNMSYGDVDRIAKLLPNELGITIARALETTPELKTLYETSPEVRRLLDMAMAVEGLPRHASTHAAGVVISRDPLMNHVPLQQTADGVVTTQYDKDRVEEIGLLKMDLLGLRTLTVIGDALKIIRETRGECIDIEKIPLDDPQTCQMLCAGETAGVFQLESAGMTNLVKELKPTSFADLIPLVALYRPGPLGSGMVEDFIRGRHGQKPVQYLHPLLEPILKDTFGVILYQEQVMQIASALAGFTLGQADLLRRAMGKKKPEVLAGQRENFLNGAAARGIDRKLAGDIFDLMAHFADYGFNKSHSAAYAVIAYQTAYLKAHYPREFMAALLTSVMGANEKVAYYIEECRRLGIAVLPPDINESLDNFTVCLQGIRFGLAAVKNVGRGAIESIIEARSKGGKFTSLADFCQRVDTRAVNKRVVESLVKCGAFDALGGRRAGLLAIVDAALEQGQRFQRERADLQMMLFNTDEVESACTLSLPDIPELPRRELLAMEKEVLGFYVTGHPLKEYGPLLERIGALNTVRLQECAEGEKVTSAGIMAAFKKVTTRNGETMGFMELEDLVGTVEVVVFPRVYQRCREHLQGDTPLVVTGRIGFQDEGVKILAEEIKPLLPGQIKIYIKIDPDRNTPERLARLKALLLRHHGDVPVYLYFAGTKKVIRADTTLWVEDTPALREAVTELFGPGCISSVCKI